ncbi:MAG: hypothetical protein PHQ28_13435 [Mycobacterium sp.]|nr:hypothetical protein [Mycobacterium sp.]
MWKGKIDMAATRQVANKLRDQGGKRQTDETKILDSALALPRNADHVGATHAALARIARTFSPEPVAARPYP